MVISASLRIGYSSPVFQGGLKFLGVGELESEFGFLIEDSDTQTLDRDHPDRSPVKITQCPHAVHQGET
jgi:hypothetical protein